MRKTLLIIGLMLTIIVFSQDTAVKTNEPLWGKAYSTPESDNEIGSFFKALAGGYDGAENYFDEDMIVGPCLWGRIYTIDKGLLAFGEGYHGQRKKDNQGFYLRYFFGAKLRNALRSQAFVELGKAFSNAKCRAATEQERNVLYQISEITVTAPARFQLGNIRRGYPLSVVERDKSVIAVYFRESKVKMMELVSGW